MPGVYIRLGSSLPWHQMDQDQLLKKKEDGISDPTFCRLL